MTPEPAVDFYGYRHLYTASKVGARGVAGFQTVACAPELESHLRALEALVESYLPVAEEVPFRCVQLAELAEAEDYLVLSRLEPWGKMPDGRGGNLWVENLVVPSAWLEAAAWDVDQVFGHTEGLWQSPEILAEITAWPHLLEAVPLPAVAPGPLDRLAFLPQALSASGLRVFVQSVVRQFFSQSPVALVAPPGMAAEDLEHLVRLAPLLLPPGRRRRATASGEGALRLRTRARVDSVPEVDLLAVPGSWYEPSSTFPGRVVDLASPQGTAPADGYGVAYVHWLLERIGDQDWTAVEAYFATPAVGEDPIETFSPPSPQRSAAPLDRPAAPVDRPAAPVERPAESLPPAPPRVVWTPGTPIPNTEDEFLEQALARREMAWEFRRKAEETMDALRKQFQEDLDQLTTALKDSMDEKMRKQEQKLAELEHQMLNRSGQIQTRLEQMLATVQEESRQIRDRITDEHERLSTDLQQSEENHRKKLVGIANAQQQQATKLFQAWQKALGDEGEKRRQQFVQEAQGWEDHLSRVEAGMGGESPMADPLMPGAGDGGAGPPTAVGGSARVPGFVEKLQRWFGDPRNRKNVLWGTLVAAVGLFLAFVAVPYVMELRKGTPPPPPPVIEEEPVAKQGYEAAIARLQEMPLATAVLTEVRAREDLRVHGRTFELSLMQLADLGTWAEAEGCTLLQEALGIGIDGDCGNISKTNARKEANEIRRAQGEESLVEKTTWAAEDKPLEQDVPLIFRHKFGLTAACSITWPLTFSGDCKPSPEGAVALWATAEKVRAARGDTTAAAVRAILEGTWTAAGQLPVDFGTRLFPIAHRLCTQEESGAGAVQDLPSAADLGDDTEVFQAALETMATCFDDLSAGE